MWFSDSQKNHDQETMARRLENDYAAAVADFAEGMTGVQRQFFGAARDKSKTNFAEDAPDDHAAWEQEICDKMEGSRHYI